MSDEDPRMDAVKECKFLIPVQLHVQLHRHRVLTGQSISSAVSEALEGMLGQILPDDEGL